MPLPLVSEQDFESQVLRSELPVLLDLYADWCQPCKQLEPILEQVANELQGKIKVLRVDVERSPMVAQAFRVQSIPMMVLLKDGRPVDQVVGLVDKKALLDMVRPVLPQAPDEIAPQDLAGLIESGRALAVDVRDASAFQRHHIPGALHMPADQVASRASELAPSDGRVRVLYGRGTEEAQELSQKLRESGVQVGFLAGGFLHWEAEGLEVERGG